MDLTLLFKANKEDWRHIMCWHRRCIQNAHCRVVKEGCLQCFACPAESCPWWDVNACFMVGRQRQIEKNSRCKEDHMPVVSPLLEVPVSMIPRS
jgi:hypothetical protein